jgi:hypothetical protein
MAAAVVRVRARRIEGRPFLLGMPCDTLSLSLVRAFAHHVIPVARAINKTTTHHKQKKTGRLRPLPLSSYSPDESLSAGRCHKRKDEQRVCAAAAAGPASAAAAAALGVAQQRGEPVRLIVSIPLRPPVFVRAAAVARSHPLRPRNPKNQQNKIRRVPGSARPPSTTRPCARWTPSPPRCRAAPCRPT